MLSGDRIYEGTFDVDGHRKALLSLIARDLGTGKIVRDYPVGRQDGFYDQITVSAVAAKDGHVDLVAESLVLD